MKHTALLLLSALLLASAAVSCGSAEEGTAASEPVPETEAASEQGAETEASYISTLGEKDFGGAEYSVIVTRQGTGTLHPATTQLTGEAINDALFTRDRKIEDDYNVKIVYPEYADSADTAVTIAKNVLAGDPVCDVYIDALSNGSAYMGHAFQQGVLYNLLDVPYLQLDKQWWSSLMYDKMTFNGKMFFTSGDMACYSFAAPSCIFMNLQVAENYDIDAQEVYQLVYDGAWTIDEVMKRTAGMHNDVNGDGVFSPDIDTYGVVNCCISLTAEEFLVGAGVEMSGTDADGNLALDLNNEHVVTVIDKLRQCFCETKASDDQNTLLHNCFMTDRTLFAVHLVETAIYYYRDMESDFSILPMPKYEAAQKSYMSYINPHTHSFIAMPLTLSDPEKTGFITEVMEYMTVENVRPAIYDTTLKGKTARNPDTQAMLDIIFNTTYTDLNAVMNFGGTIDALSNALFNGKDLASALTKSENSAAKAAAKVMALFEDKEG